MILLHITAGAAWDAALPEGAYAAPSLQDEGFIHLSTPAQVLDVAAAHYGGVPGLVLLCVDPDRLGAPLRYEAADRGDERFPHLYGPLNVDAVVEVVPFPEGPGGFGLPDRVAELAAGAGAG